MGRGATWATGIGVARVGMSCLGLESKHTEETPSWLCDVRVVPRTSYRFTAWIKSANVRDGNGAYFMLVNKQGVRTQSVVGSCDYRQVEMSFNSGDLKCIRIAAVLGSLGAAWYDETDLVVLSFSAPSQANLVPNPTFNAYISGEHHPLGWSVLCSQGENRASWESMGGQGTSNSGSYCLKIESTAGGDNQWYTDVRVDTDTNYRLSGEIKCHELTGGGAFFSVSNLSGVRTQTVIGTQPEWKRCSVDFNSGTIGIARLSAVYGGGILSTGEAWFATIYLVKLDDGHDSTPNLVPNPALHWGTAEGLPYGWVQKKGLGEGNYCVWASGPGIARVGTHCLGLVSKQGTECCWYCDIRVRPSTVYQLSGWIKVLSVDGGNGAYLTVCNIAGAKTSAVYGSCDYQQVQVIFESGTVECVRVAAVIGPGTNGQAWYDDLELIEVPASKPLVDESTSPVTKRFAVSHPGVYSRVKAEEQRSDVSSPPPLPTTARPDISNIIKQSNSHAPNGRTGMPKFGGSAKCKYCKKAVYATEMICYNDMSFHEACFKCLACGCRVPLTDVSMIENHLYCSWCFSSKFKKSGGKYKSFVFRQSIIPIHARAPAKPGVRNYCPKCNSILSDDCVECLGRTYHKQCFSCSKCGEIMTLNTVSDPAGLSCVACLHSAVSPPTSETKNLSTTSLSTPSSSLNLNGSNSPKPDSLSGFRTGKPALPVCVSCVKPVYPVDGIKYDTRSWHGSCFRCISCRASLTVHSVSVMDGSIHCRSCFLKAFTLQSGRVGGSKQWIPRTGAKTSVSVPVLHGSDVSPTNSVREHDSDHDDEDLEADNPEWQSRLQKRHQKQKQNRYEKALSQAVEEIPDINKEGRGLVLVASEDLTIDAAINKNDNTIAQHTADIPVYIRGEQGAPVMIDIHLNELIKTIKYRIKITDALSVIATQLPDYTPKQLQLDDENLEDGFSVQECGLFANVTLVCKRL